jgi:hypothetical protein
MTWEIKELLREKERDIHPLVNIDGKEIDRGIRGTTNQVILKHGTNRRYVGGRVSDGDISPSL